MVYLVSYDLNEPDKDYSAIIDAIGRYANPYRVLKSQWLICSNKSAKEIFNQLVEFVDEDDKLFVCEVNENHFGKFNAKSCRQNNSFLPGLLG